MFSVLDRCGSALVRLGFLFTSLGSTRSARLATERARGCAELLDRMLSERDLSDAVAAELIARPALIDNLLGSSQFMARLAADEGLVQMMSAEPSMLREAVRSRLHREGIDGARLEGIDQILDAVLLGGRENEPQAAAHQRAREHGRQVDYSLPGYVVSFPRSGSNFLQNVLEQSSGMACRSRYARLRINPCEYLTLKSHAISPAMLNEEIRLQGLRKADTPSKIIWLIRDPRDVMISFYEYTQSERGVAISQDDFLAKVDYHWATFAHMQQPVPYLLTFPRRAAVEPLSVGEAFSAFRRNWSEHARRTGEVLQVRYEDLVDRPRETFATVFQYLELDCPLAEESLGDRVSLYSSERRPRGVAYGWRRHDARYRTLLDTVERVLGEEIVHLRYDALPSDQESLTRRSA